MKRKGHQLKSLQEADKCHRKGERGSLTHTHTHTTHCLVGLIQNQIPTSFVGLVFQRQRIISPLPLPKQAKTRTSCSSPRSRPTALSVPDCIFIRNRSSCRPLNRAVLSQPQSTSTFFHARRIIRRKTDHTLNHNTHTTSIRPNHIQNASQSNSQFAILFRPLFLFQLASHRIALFPRPQPRASLARHSSSAISCPFPPLLHPQSCSAFYGIVKTLGVLRIRQPPDPEIIYKVAPFPFPTPVPLFLFYNHHLKHFLTYVLTPHLSTLSNIRIALIRYLSIAAWNKPLT